ncbi:hypothetical protein [Sphingomonas sp. Leaf230]|uniref:hypothetical protein n=1 Tax=Sphingomonas sp. Leaf230 TaxID=1735694 RepID=UPI0012E11B49|nr:hypothetical protein [Sphingomonas sp. Leaf230]
MTDDLNSRIPEMETVARLLRLALPLAAKSDSYVVCAMIETAIELSVTRLAALKADATSDHFS